METTLKKEKMKKVIADINVEEVYHAGTECPYCETGNDMEVEEENVTVIETCWSCKKKYKVKIPKNSFY